MYSDQASSPSGARHLVTTTFVQTNGKSGKNPKFFSAGRITYLINTRLLTRGFYIKKFFEEVIIFFRAPIWRPMRYLVLLGELATPVVRVGPKIFSAY